MHVFISFDISLRGSEEKKTKQKKKQWEENYVSVTCLTELKILCLYYSYLVYEIYFPAQTDIHMEKTLNMFN